MDFLRAESFVALSELDFSGSDFFSHCRTLNFTEKYLYCSLPPSIN